MPNQPSEETSVRDTLVNLISNLLARYKGNKNDNTKEILMLLAALQLVDIGGESNNKQALAAARRLISGAK